MNSSFEEIGCVGYNPAFRELTATVKIKRDYGYRGNLCSDGSQEYVRFYIDYLDGNGWIDKGVTAINVHDIPTKKDCDGKHEKPIDYVARLKIQPKQYGCTKANIPKVKAVLSWNSIPQANDPNLTAGTYIWGSVKEDRIQIPPITLLNPGFPMFEIEHLLEKAILNPDISLNQLASIEPEEKAFLKKAKTSLTNSKLDFQELSEAYKADKIEPHRFGYKLLNELGLTECTDVVKNITNLFDSSKISLSDSLINLKKLNCNTNYEELFCVGADYNQEALVGTLKVKKSSGYSGDLCKKGSKEYVSFWIQEEKKCKWIHAGTTFVEVHDIKEIPKKGISYSVVLPYDFSKLKQSCKRPQVVKVRAILSWNTPPTGRNCAQWGNVVESYIQLKPKTKWTGNSPKLITVGGISTDNINAFTGLTIAGAKLEFNQANTYPDSPFGGVIVVQGISDPLAGQKYKIKITNLTTGGSYYLSNNLQLLGFNLVNGSVTHPVVIPVAEEYTYQPYQNNISSILARFTPGTNDKFQVTIENTNGTSDSAIIQMDNTFPEVSITIDDNGNCSYYAKGSDIIGSFTVDDNYLDHYALTTNLGAYTKTAPGLDQSGTNNGDGHFKIASDPLKNCGSIYLKATQKTIRDSVRTGTYRDVSKIVCLG